MQEYCDCGTLASIAANYWSRDTEGDMQMLQRLLLLQDVASGLQFLHSRHVIHSDLVSWATPMRYSAKDKYTQYQLYMGQEVFAGCGLTIQVLLGSLILGTPCVFCRVSSALMPCIRVGYYSLISAVHEAGCTHAGCASCVD